MKKYSKILLALGVIFVMGISNYNIGYAQTEDQNFRKYW